MSRKCLASAPQLMRSDTNVSGRSTKWVMPAGRFQERSRKGLAPVRSTKWVMPAGRFQERSRKGLEPVRSTKWV